MQSLRAESVHVQTQAVEPSFADDLLDALHALASDDYFPTDAIPGAEPRPSVSGEDEAREWEERWEDYANWMANLDRYITDPDPWGEACYFGGGFLGHDA